MGGTNKSKEKPTKQKLGGEGGDEVGGGGGGQSGIQGHVTTRKERL